MLAAGIWLTGGHCAHFARDVFSSSRDLEMRWRPPHREVGDRELARTRQPSIGRAYHKSISSNILQHASLATFVDVLRGTMQVDVNRLRELQRWQEDRIAKKVDSLLASYYPELYPFWRSGIRRRHGWRRRVSAGLHHLIQVPSLSPTARR